MKTLTIKLLLLKMTLITFVFQSCNKYEAIEAVEQNVVQSGVPVFDPELFCQNVIEGMGEKWAGYQMAINVKGQAIHTHHFGEAITGNDGNSDQYEGIPMYAASISKFITAVTIVHALDKYQGGAENKLDTSIVPYLPDDWQIGTNVNSISIRDLLLHQTGIPTNAGIDYTSLKTIIQNGLPFNRPYNYCNANFALLRIILPKITEDITSVSGASDKQMQDKTIASFIRYTMTQIFDPNSIGAKTQPYGVNKALYYKYDDLPNTNGWAMSDMSSRIGNGGWFMSSVNIAKFLAILNETEDILNKESRELVYTNFLGLSDSSLPTNTPNGDHGVYYTKAGSFQNNGRGVRNIIAVFPQTRTEIVVMANSRGGNLDNSSAIRNMIFNAYDDAWVVKD